MCISDPYLDNKDLWKFEKIENRENCKSFNDIVEGSQILSQCRVKRIRNRGGAMGDGVGSKRVRYMHLR